MIHGYAALIAMHEYEGRATHGMLSRDPKSPPSLCEHRLTAPELTIEAHDVAGLEETPDLFPSSSVSTLCCDTTCRGMFRPPSAPTALGRPLSQVCSQLVGTSRDFA